MTEAETTIAELQPLADNARSIRETLKTRGKVAATRVHGKDFKEDEWNGVFDILPFPELTRQVEELEQTAREV